MAAESFLMRWQGKRTPQNDFRFLNAEQFGTVLRGR